MMVMDVNRSQTYAVVQQREVLPGTTSYAKVESCGALRAGMVAQARGMSAGEYVVMLFHCI